MLERVEAVAVGVSGLVAGTLGERERYAAERAVHQLTGTLGMLGLPRGTDVSREIEDALAAGPGPARPGLLALADELRVIVRRGPQTLPVEAASELDRPDAAVRPLLHVIPPSDDLCARLAAAAERRGLRVECSPDPGHAHLGLRSGAPDAVLLELAGDAVATGALRLIADLDTRESPVPCSSSPERHAHRACRGCPARRTGLLSSRPRPRADPGCGRA